MADDPPFDNTFYNNFKEIWNRSSGRILQKMPDDVAKAFAMAVPAGMFGHKAVIDAFKVAPGEKLRLWWNTRPKFSTSNDQGLTAHEETRTIGIAGFIAAYGGLLLGTAIVAAYETYGGDRVFEMMRPAAREVERVTGRSFAVALESMLLDVSFHGAAFHKAMHVGRAVSAHHLYSRPQRRPAGGW